MMEKRLANTREAARRLGVTAKIFLSLRQKKGFPAPVIARAHHFIWDMKAIEQFLDKSNNLITESDQDYWDKLVLERINGGSHQGEISRSAQ